MKTTKLVIGIISMVLFLLIVFQSWVVEISNAITENGEISGSAGLFLALCMLVAGIVGVVTRKGSIGGYVSAGFYTLGGIVGITNFGSFTDLLIWSVLCFIFAIVFVIAGIVIHRSEKKQLNEEK